MALVQQKKVNKNFYVTLVFLALMAVIAFIQGPPSYVKVGAEVFLLGLFIYIRRSFIFFYKGVKHLQNGDNEKAFIYFDKAYNSKADGQQVVSIGSAYIQYNDSKKGIDILEKYISKSKDINYVNVAKVTISMGYWKEHRLDDAINVLQNLWDDGYVDNNLLVNLQTYLLEKGDLKEAKRVLNETKKITTESNGMVENRGWYYILNGEWAKAYDLYDDLVNDRQPKFPEAYIHGAQVMIHKGERERALDFLGWALGKMFTNTCPFTKEYVQNLILGLDNPETSNAFMESMNNNVQAIAVGKPFEGQILAKDFDGPHYEVKEQKLVNKPETEKKEEGVEDNTSLDEDDDERMPNTDLGEDE